MQPSANARFQRKPPPPPAGPGQGLFQRKPPPPPAGPGQGLFQRKRPPPPTGGGQGLFQRKRPAATRPLQEPPPQKPPAEPPLPLSSLEPPSAPPEEPRPPPEEPRPPPEEPPPPPEEPPPPPLEPTPPPEKPPRPSVKHITVLPKGLRSLGNSKGWTQLLTHLKEKKHEPVVLWGPTGCGKTCGVRELLGAMNYSIVELDGSDGEDTKQLITCVKRIRDVKGMQGPSAVLLDDYESLTEDARKRMADMLKKANDTTLAPIIITCTQFKEPRLRGDLHAFTNVRLFPPDEHVCKEWFDKQGFPLDKGGAVQQCYPKEGWEADARDQLATGDLRRVHKALEWKAVTKHKLGVGGESTFLNSFQATRQLLLRKVRPTKWADGAEPRDASLIHEHIPKYVDDIDALANMFDSLSESDALAPSRFECMAAQQPYQMQLVASATHHFSKARSVDALYPPKPLPYKHRSAEKLDTPRLLLEAE